MSEQQAVVAILWCFVMGSYLGYHLGMYRMHRRMLQRMDDADIQAKERYMALYQSFVKRFPLVDATQKTPPKEP